MATRAAFHAILSTLALAAILATPGRARAQFDSPLIDMGSAGASTNVNQEALENIPGARDPWSVLSTSPGVFPAGEPGRPSAGTTGDALITVDGIRVGPANGLDPGAFADQWVGDLEVQKDGRSAEYGDAASGVINVVTKSGTTNQWQGTGRYLVDGDDASGLGAVQDPSIRVDVAQDAAGGYCLNGFKVMSAGQPIADGDGPVQFAFDQPITIGVTSGPGTTYGAGDGSLNLSQIPGCAGQSINLTFVDTPTPVTPPVPTHVFLGKNGTYLFDMGRIGAEYGIPDRTRASDDKLDDSHLFSGGFYQSGLSSYIGGGFRATTDDPSTAGGSSVFLYGVDPEGVGGDWSMGAQLSWDSKAIRAADSPAQMPDMDGDGKPDSVFLSLAMLAPIGRDAIGGGFQAGAVGTGGGTLKADPSWAVGEGYASLDDAIRRGGFSGLPYSFGGNAAQSGRAAMPNDLGGPILRDRLWFVGTYGPPVSDDEDDEPLFSPQYYVRAPNLAEAFLPGSFTTGSVQSAPVGQGVQGVGLEVRSGESRRTRAPAEVDYAPGGASPDGVGLALRSLADELDSPLLYVVADGGPTGEVFQVQVVHPSIGPVRIDGLVALEPVAATAADRERFERELGRAGGQRETLTAAGYCLEMDALAPPPGTVYRVAPAAKQAAFAPMRRALDAARRLRDAGALHPDSDPADYYHSVRQWAVWTVEKGFDRAGFLDAFVERTEKNFREAGQAWSADVAAAVRSFGEGRWVDIRAVLDEAEGSS